MAALSYTLQGSLLEPDEHALVCPNCGAYNERPHEWLEARLGDQFPCALCGVSATIPRLPAHTIGD